LKNCPTRTTPLDTCCRFIKALTGEPPEAGLLLRRSSGNYRWAHDVVLSWAQSTRAIHSRRQAGSLLSYSSEMSEHASIHLKIYPRTSRRRFIQPTLRDILNRHTSTKPSPETPTHLHTKQIPRLSIHRAAQEPPYRKLTARMRPLERNQKRNKQHLTRSRGTLGQLQFRIRARTRL
jgi:hypothetical protein